MCVLSWGIGLIFNRWLARVILCADACLLVLVRDISIYFRNTNVYL